MRIEGIIWMRQVVDKLAFKHHVRIEEVEELFESKPKFLFVEKGERKGENVYMALGQTDAGRYYEYKHDIFGQAAITRNHLQSS